MQYTFEIGWNGAFSTIDEALEAEISKVFNGKYEQVKILLVEPCQDKLGHIQTQFCYHIRVIAELL